MVPAGSCRIPRVPHYSGTACPSPKPSLTGLSPSAARLSRRFCWPRLPELPAALQPRPCRDRAGLGSCAFARHYLRNHFCFLFLRVMRCFSSPGSPRAWRGAGIASGGLPHSEIRASAGICPWARLIAACHVLLRLREPRHPSCALFSFPYSFTESGSVSFRLFRFELQRGRPLRRRSFVLILF